MGAVVRVDSKGRLVVPKSLHEKVGLKEGVGLESRPATGVIVVEPLRSAAHAYFGAFKAERWPEDLDTFLVEAVRKLWSREATST